ncbi:MAG TPA: hypothetical protein VGL05_03800 [Kribbella sp.]
MTGESSKDARARAIDRLPTSYAVALRLRDAGAVDDVIASALGIEVVSVPALLALAEAKLAAIRRPERDLHNGCA